MTSFEVKSFIVPHIYRLYMDIDARTVTLLCNNIRNIYIYIPSKPVVLFYSYIVFSFFLFLRDFLKDGGDVGTYI